MTSSEEEFTLSHVFTDVSSMKEEMDVYSPIEEHCRVPWQISIDRTSGRLGLYLHCLQEKKNREWSIEVRQEGIIRRVHGTTHSTNGASTLKDFWFRRGFKTYSRNMDVIHRSTNKWSGYGWWEFISWEDMMKHYVIDDTLKVEFRVKIKKMVGIPLRNFNESVKEFSDTVLTVENQKFYVSKLFLASQSTFFKSLLLKLSESKEHTLENVKAADFLMFLELLHGDDPIDDATIKGITYLADMYGAKTAMEKCEQFLVKNSRKFFKEKLHLAHLYKLEKLKNHCLSKISTVAQIRSVLTDNLIEMDPVVSRVLLQKFMARYEMTSKNLFVLNVLFVFVLCVLLFLCIRTVIG